MPASLLQLLARNLAWQVVRVLNSKPRDEVGVDVLDRPWKEGLQLNIALLITGAGQQGGSVAVGGGGVSISFLPVIRFHVTRGPGGTAWVAENNLEEADAHKTRALPLSCHSP